MGLSARHVGELVAELSPLVERARVQDVQPHPPRDLLLILEPAEGGALRRLRLSADAEGARLHLQFGRVQRHRGALGPFFREVEQHLAGTTLVSLTQVAGDRLVRLAFDSGAALVLELTGRHPNLLLLVEGDGLRAVLAPPAAESPAAERLRPGATWTPPPGAPPPDPGPSLAQSLPVPPTPADHLAGLAQLVPGSWRVESSLGLQAESRFDEGELRELVRRLERRHKSARDLVAGLEERARQSDRADRVRQDAELLTAHMQRLQRGLCELTVPDAFHPDSPPRTIPLDPGLSPRKNVEKLFARFKKLERARAKLPDELALAQAQAQLVEDLLARAAEPDADARGLEAEALASGLLKAKQEVPKKARSEPRKPYLVFHTGEGHEVRVGRNARDNDELTFRASRGNDLWLHTADAPGSHVILRLEKGQDEPSRESLLDAAHLAIHYSPRRGAGKVDIHVARRKEVHKPRKAPAGLVTLSGGRILHVRFEPARLERILAARDQRPGRPN